MSRLAQFAAAFTGIAVALAVVYYILTLPNYDPYLARRPLTGAFIVIGGTIIWLGIQARGALLNRLVRSTYVLSIDGREESFRSRKRAEERIGELRSQGSTSLQIRMRKMTFQTDSRGSVVVKNEDVPIKDHYQAL